MIRKLIADPSAAVRPGDRHPAPRRQVGAEKRDLVLQLFFRFTAAADRTWLEACGIEADAWAALVKSQPGSR